MNIENDGRTEIIAEKIRFLCTELTTNLLRGPGWKPGLGDERPATNRLKHNTAIYIFFSSGETNSVNARLRELVGSFHALWGPRRRGGGLHLLWIYVGRVKGKRFSGLSNNSRF
jgi:hypothetical protein